MSKRRNLLIKSSPFILAIASIAIFAYEYGPDPGYTAAPGDNPTGCMASGCHTDAPNSGPGSVKIVAAGGTTYVPGQAQQIQVTVADSTERKYGFELSARVDSSPKLMGAGTLTSTDGNTQVIDCKTPAVVPFAGSCPSGNTLQWIEHNITGYTRSAAPAATYSFNWTPPSTNVGTVTLYAAGNAGSGALIVSLTHTYLASLQLSPASTTSPTIGSGGILPHDSKTATAIQPGSWVDIYGTNLAGGTATWNGDFPTSLGGTSVMVNNKPAYLSYVSPTQVNIQVPDDTATGIVNVTVTSGGATATSTVNLASFGPSFSLLDATHVAAIILRSDGSGTYGGGSYDIVGPTGTSLGYKTVAAKAGDVVELFGVGFGPTNPTVPAGHAYSGAAPTTNAVQLQIHGASVTPFFSGISGAGLYQINLTIPAGLGTGDQPLLATVGGVSTQSFVVLSLQ
ncbi:MAG TPA: choice-of-anchor V domain-containing protein [Bryobacteraceae bacterium]|nr:choice-of-anchor V domain-containing protein [Bryobacteraceae bacterium]